MKHNNLNTWGFFFLFLSCMLLTITMAANSLIAGFLFLASLGAGIGILFFKHKIHIKIPKMPKIKLVNTKPTHPTLTPPKMPEVKPPEAEPQPIMEEDNEIQKELED